MKQTISMILGLSFAIMGVSHANDNQSYTDTARVLHSKPIYDTVQVAIPHKECRQGHRGQRYSEYESRSHSDSYTPTIAGALIGGIVGNQFGKGNGKKAMTLAGAVLGGSLGNDAGNTHRSHRSQRWVAAEPRCKTVTRYESRQEIVGYRVKYRYNGKKFWTRTTHKPRSTIQVRVAVNPVEDQAYDSPNKVGYDNDRYGNDGYDDNNDYMRF